MEREVEIGLFRERTTPSYKDLIRFFWYELSLDNGPQFQNVILNLLDVDCTRDSVSAGHLLDIGFKFTDVLADNFGIFDFALLCNLCVWCSRESNFKKRKKLINIERQDVNVAHHLCTSEVF